MPSCLGCGQENPDGFRFCGACGSPLNAARVVGEERKVVTVLFCDLVGFTARSDRADPEDVSALLRPYHARVRAEIERFQGTLDKFIGDAVMAVFGAPVAHEDDPERAVRTALRMLAAIGELNEADPTLRLAVRIGVETGEALVTLDPAAETEGVVGDVVNTASRLQGVAPAGGVVVGEATWRATGTLFDFEELEPVRVKGKAEPVPIWRVLAPTSRTGSDTGRPATPFVGRHRELELLEGLYRRVLREHGMQLVTITGEPGVGKSRLVGEFSAFVDAQPELVAWRQGRCLPYGDGITFWALGEIVKAQAGILDSDDPPQVAGKLDTAVSALFAEASERDWVKARLAPLLGLVPTETASVERSESFAAWQRFIDAIAAGRPLVLVVEDLHWADPALLQFLEYLVDRPAAVDLLVVTTARAELAERHPGWGGGLRNAATISLSPLTDEDTARLAAALVGRSVLPAEIQALVLERAGGNPLHAEELVRLLSDRGLLRAGGLRTQHDAEFLLPGTLQALIAARLDALSPKRKGLLQDAAVVGKVFWSGALAAMGVFEEDEVRADLRELERKQLIRKVGESSVEHQTEYRFWHALVRDVAYAQIPRAGRARRHQATAEWMRDLAGDRVGDRAELIAHHYTQALDLTRAARSSPAEVARLEEQARRFLGLAGDRASSLDVARALVFHARALDLCPAHHPARAALLVKHGEAAFQAGDHAAARSSLEAAVAAFEGAGDRLSAGDALVTLAVVTWNMGEAAASRARLEDAIALLEREPAGPQLGHAYAELAAHRADDGAFEEALLWAERSLALADEGGQAEQRLRPLGYIGVMRCSLGDATGFDVLREALRVALDAGLSYQAALMYANLANHLCDFNPAASLDTYQEGIQLAERRGLTEVAMWMRAGMLERHFDFGRWDELLREAAKIIAWYRTHGQESFVILSLEILTAHVLLLRGQLARAEELVERSLLVADAPYLDRLVLLTVAALASQSRNDQAAAIRHVVEFHTLTSDRPWVGRARYLPDLVRVCAAARQLPLAYDLLDGFSSAAAGTGLDRSSLLTANAVIKEAEGKHDAAADLYDRALKGWEASGHVLEHAQALLGWGRCLHRLGRAAARARLGEARAILGGLGCRPLVTEADAWLQEAATAGA
jgi:class 3 adenylate cyclase/tetratricopeptide (TPR) repeat protein